MFYMKIITFDKSAKEFILDSFDKKINNEGYVIEKKTGNKVIANDGQDLLIGQFGGVKKGSEVFIKSDIISVMKLLDSLS